MSQPSAAPSSSNSDGKVAPPGLPRRAAPSAPRPSVPVRRLLALARPELRTLLFATVALIVSTGLGLIYQQAIKVIMNAVTGYGSQSAIDQALSF